MLILVTFILLLITALTLVALRIFQPEARYTWLIAVGGAMLGLASVFFWQLQLPFDLVSPNWQLAASFNSSVLFTADKISFPLALCIAVLILSILLTSVTQPVYVNSIIWAGIIILGSAGILVVTANNPLTLLLIWASLDLTELIIHLSSVNGRANNEKVVIAFSTRALGIGLLLWASMISIAETNASDFQSMSASSGIYLIIASGLRLGVLPLHLPYTPDSEMRRGFGTAIRFIAAASSLILLGRVSVINSNFTFIFMILACIAALYSGWMWLRAADELTGRPHWVIGIASLAILSALSGNAIGAIAWGCALILVGGALFLASVQNNLLNRIMLIGAFSISSLPFSLTASAWLGNLSFFIPFAILAQALLMAGFIRHATRSTNRDSLDTQPAWMKVVYSSGIILLILTQLILGLFGFDSVSKIGAWVQALIASILTFILLWASRRFRIFSPVRAHWVSSTESRVDNMYQGLWSIYYFLGRISRIVTQALEGEGGIMWTLLFLILFVSLITQGSP
jgi:hypothetical protein